MRFLGTTPSTSSILTTLKSIIYQISRIFNLKQKLDFNFDNSDVSRIRLKNILKEQFFSIFFNYPNKKLVIILDSIDQLNTSDYCLDWIINEFPENIKMIYSTLPEHGQILDNFKEKHELVEDNFLSVSSLDKELATEIIRDWLVKASRSISENQWSVINKMFFNRDLYPLYIKLIFDIICKWPSFYQPDSNFENCTSIDNCIEYLFGILESIHGKLLFKRAIIYMSSFRNGISESEIEDILSLDDDVLYQIFEFHAPPVRRLPIALWSRIKHDLRGYMVEKEVHATRVIYWYHRRFIEVT